MAHQASQLVVQPVLPFNPNNISLLDILLPPLLLACAILIYDIQSHSPSYPSHAAHLFKNKTFHARFLPKQAAVAFGYSVLQLGIDLKLLEESKLNLPYLFCFRDPNRLSPSLWSAPATWLASKTVCSISPADYLHQRNPRHHPRKFAKPHSIRQALLYELKTNHAVDVDQIGAIYLVTMPSYLGMAGINPLSVYFCYHHPSPNSDALPPLHSVVLEVHNTFSERHVYLLTIGTNETPAPQPGFEHEWLVPRAFHVSPFNDRSGSYRISLSDPLSPLRTGQPSPVINIKVVLLTSTGAKKLFASLHGTGVPLSASTLAASLLRFPFTLLLTSLRIMYQSFKIHMCKPRLDVYPRPEPLYDGPAALAGQNPAAAGAKRGAVGWQRPDWTSGWAKRIVVEFLQRRVDRIAEDCARERAPRHEDYSDRGGLSDDEPDAAPVAVVLRPADLTEPETTIAPAAPTDARLAPVVLTITYGSPGAFKDMVLWPTPLLAQRVGSVTEGGWAVSSDALFARIFDAPMPPHAQRRALPLPVPWTMRVRTWYVRWQVSLIGPATRENARLSRRSSWLPPPLFLPIEMGSAYTCPPSPVDWTLAGTGAGARWRTWVVVVEAAAMEWMYYVMAKWIFRFRFVENQEPWSRLARAVDQPRSKGGGGIGIGSVRREE